MDAERYAFPDQFTAPGSDIYYAIRFAPVDQRQPLTLINALYRSLRDVPLECSDPAVARAKLEWWSEELEKTGNDQARHPITRALNPVFQQQPEAREHFTQVLLASRREVGGVTLDSQADLETHCAQTGARFARLLTLVAGGDRTQQQAAERLGHFLRTVEIIRNLGADLRHERCLLPIEMLAQRGLSCGRLLTTPGREGLNELLRDVASNPRQTYRQTLAGLQGGHAALGAARSLAAMADALLREIERDEFQVLHRRTSLTPLHKLWIAWRSHRQARRR